VLLWVSQKDLLALVVVNASQGVGGADSRDRATGQARLGQAWAFCVGSGPRTRALTL
jgi:hypothetical protein